MMTDDEFVKAWVYAYKYKIGLKRMCSKFGLNYIEASQRASKLRRAGVKLPTMPKAGEKHSVLEANVDALNEIISHTLGPEALNYRTR